jgi:hypothetical protein
MSNKKRALYLISVVMILSLVTLACGTGYSTTSKLSGNSGEVKVSLKSADGANSNSVEINEDWSYAQIATTVTATTEAGSCAVSITGGENTAISLNTAAGSPGQASGVLVTDGFGEVDLQTNCAGAENLTVQFNFTLK